MNTTLATPPPPPTQDTTLEWWTKMGEQIVRTYRTTDKALETCQWEIGDWLVTGETGFGKKAYDEAERITGFERASLYNIVWVVRKFPRVPNSLRSETNLTWSHFKELARIQDEKFREIVLEEVNDGLPHSVREVREMVDTQLKSLKKLTRSGGKPRPPQTKIYQRILFAKERKRFKQLAQAKGKAPDQLLREIVHEYLVAHKDELATKSKRARKVGSS
jgi:hypothetical protein